MKQLIVSIVCVLCSIAAYAKPQCQSFNNYDDKVTIVFTDDNVSNGDSISDVVLHTCGKHYAATSVKTEITDCVATVTLTFPHITQFSNPKVELRLNGKKHSFKVCH